MRRFLEVMELFDYGGGCLTAIVRNTRHWAPERTNVTANKCKNEKGSFFTVTTSVSQNDTALYVGTF